MTESTLKSNYFEQFFYYGRLSPQNNYFNAMGRKAVEFSRHISAAVSQLAKKKKKNSVFVLTRKKKGKKATNHTQVFNS